MSVAGIRLPAYKPMVTAGFRSHPEMCPIAKAIVRTDRPKAKATPSKPMPTCGKAAAKTALPQPPNTSQKVPRNSAADRLPKDMRRLLSIDPKADSKTQRGLTRKLDNGRTVGRVEVVKRFKRKFQTRYPSFSQVDRIIADE